MAPNYRDYLIAQGVLKAAQQQAQQPPSPGLGMGMPAPAYANIMAPRRQMMTDQRRLTAPPVVSQPRPGMAPGNPGAPAPIPYTRWGDTISSVNARPPVLPVAAPPVVPQVPQVQDIRRFELNTQLPSGTAAPPELPPVSDAEWEAARQEQIRAFSYLTAAPNDAQAQAAYDAAVARVQDLSLRRNGPNYFTGKSAMDLLDVPRDLIVTEMGANAYDVATGKKDEWSADWAAIAPGNWMLAIPWTDLGLDETRFNQDFANWANDPRNWQAIRNASEAGFQADENSPRFTGGRAVWELFINSAGTGYKILSDIMNDPTILASFGATLGDDLVRAGARATGSGRPMAANVYRGAGRALSVPQTILDATVDAPFNAVGAGLRRGIGFVDDKLRPGKPSLLAESPYDQTVESANTLDRTLDVYEGTRPVTDPDVPDAGPMPPTEPPAPPREGPGWYTIEPTGELTRTIKDPAGNVVEVRTIERANTWNENQVARDVEDLNRNLERTRAVEAGYAVPVEDQGWMDPAARSYDVAGRTDDTLWFGRDLMEMQQFPENKPFAKAFIEAYYDSGMAKGHKDYIESLAEGGANADLDVKALARAEHFATEVLPTWRSVNEQMTAQGLKAIPEPTYVFKSGDQLDPRVAQFLRGDRSVIPMRANVIEHAVFGDLDSSTAARRYLREADPPIGDKSGRALANDLSKMRQKLGLQLSQNPEAVRARARQANQQNPDPLAIEEVAPSPRPAQLQTMNDISDFLASPERTAAAPVATLPDTAERAVDAAQTRLPEMRDNYRKRLDFYAPVLYRETGMQRMGSGTLDDFLPFLHHNNERATDDLFFANTPNFARGQGTNKGVFVEVDARALQGQVNRQKPGWEFAYQNGEAEFIANHNFPKDVLGSVRAITVLPDAQIERGMKARWNAQLAKFVDKLGWRRVENPDGSVSYLRPDVAAPTALPDPPPPIQIVPPKVTPQGRLRKGRTAWDHTTDDATARKALFADTKWQTALGNDVKRGQAGTVIVERGARKPGQTTIMEVRGKYRVQDRDYKEIGTYPTLQEAINAADAAEDLYWRGVNKPDKKMVQAVVQQQPVDPRARFAARTQNQRPAMVRDAVEEPPAAPDVTNARPNVVEIGKKRTTRSREHDYGGDGEVTTSTVEVSGPRGVVRVVGTLYHRPGERLTPGTNGRIWAAVVDEDFPSLALGHSPRQSSILVDRVKYQDALDAAKRYHGVEPGKKSATTPTVRREAAVVRVAGKSDKEILDQLGTRPKVTTNGTKVSVASGNVVVGDRTVGLTADGKWIFEGTGYQGSKFTVERRTLADAIDAAERDQWPSMNRPRIGAVSDQTQRLLATENQAEQALRREYGMIDGPGGTGSLSRADTSHVGTAHQIGKISDEDYNLLSRVVEYNGRPMRLWEAYEMALRDFINPNDPAAASRKAREVLAEQLMSPEAKAYSAQAKLTAAERKALNAEKSAAKRVGLKALRAYDAWTNFYRQRIMFNWARGFAGTLADQVERTYSLALNGEYRAALNTWNPKTMFRFLRDEQGKSSVIDALDGVAQYRKVYGKNPPADWLQLNETRFMEGGNKNIAGEGLGWVYNKTPLRATADPFIRDARVAFDRNGRYQLGMASWTRNLNDATLRMRGLVRTMAERQGLSGEQAVRSFDQFTRGEKGFYRGNEVFDWATEFGFDPGRSKRLGQDWAGLANKASADADARVRKLLFSYKMTNADNILRRGMLFHYWISRAAVLHARTTLQNPWLLNSYIRGYEAMQREAEANGYPPNIIGFTKLMQSEMGMYALVSPANLLVPFFFLVEGAQSPDEEDSGLVRFIQRWGGFINPQIEMAAAILGFHDRVPDITGTTALRRAFRVAQNWLNNNGYDGIALGDAGTWNEADFLDQFLPWAADKANAGVRWATGGEGSPFSDLVTADPGGYELDVITSIMVDMAEADWGPMDGWTDEQWDQFHVAQTAVITGSKGNDLSNQAIEAYSDERLTGVGLTAVTPGGIIQRYAPRDQDLINSRAGYDALDAGTQPTPEQQAAMDTRRVVTAGSTEDASLDMGAAAYDAIGTPRQQQLHDYWTDIVYNLDDQKFDGQVLWIGNTQLSVDSLRALTEDERMEIADQWIASVDGTDDLKGYRDERKAYLAANPEYGSYEADWKGTIRGYEGGVRQFRIDRAAGNPNFKAAVAEKEAQLKKDGVDAALIPDELDSWTYSIAAYKAAQGIKDNIYDPDPLSTGDQPTVNTILRAQSGDGGGSSTKKATVTIAQKVTKELREYEQEAAMFSDILTGFGIEGGYESINNPLMRPVLEGQFGDLIPSMSTLLRQYLSWVEYIRSNYPGSDTSPEAFQRVVESVNQDAAA